MRRLLQVLLLSALALVLMTQRADATFHINLIAELYPGSYANPDAQYVMLQSLASFQNQIGGKAIITFKPDGTRGPEHAGVLDADLLTQKRNLEPEALKLGPEAEARIDALSGPAKGGGQGEVGEGDGVHSRRADATGPASGKRKGTGDTSHGQPPEETHR